MNDFNFFSTFLVEEKKEREKNTINVYSIIALVILLAILSSAAYNFIRLKNIQSEISASDSFLNNPENLSKLQEVDEISSQINQIQKDSQILTNVNEQIKNNRSVIVTALDFINAQVTEDMYFDNIHISNREVTVDGSALSKLHIAQFQHNVRNSGYFDAVFVDNIARVEQEVTAGATVGPTGKYAYDFDAVFIVKDSVYDNFDGQLMIAEDSEETGENTQEEDGEVANE